MSEDERLAAVLALLPAWVIATDDRLVRRDESDIMRIVGDGVAEIFPTGEPEDLAAGTAALLYVLEVGLTRAAMVAGMGRAELAVDIARRVSILNFGRDA